MPSGDLASRIIELLDKNDPGATTPTPSTSFQMKAPLVELDGMLSQSLVMEAIDFFDANNLFKPADFCAAFQELSMQ